MKTTIFVKFYTTLMPMSSFEISNDTHWATALVTPTQSLIAIKHYITSLLGKNYVKSVNRFETK